MQRIFEDDKVTVDVVYHGSLRIEVTRYSDHRRDTVELSDASKDTNWKGITHFIPKDSSVTSEHYSVV